MAISEKDGTRRVRGEVNQIYLENDLVRRVFFAILNSSSYFQFFCVYTDGRHINPSDVKDFHFDYSSMTVVVRDQLVDLSYKLEDAMQENTKTWRKSGLLIDSVDSPQTKPIIDEIDQVLAKHYRFTDEELDFIINYDIKYRMGLGLASADEDS